MSLETAAPAAPPTRSRPVLSNRALLNGCLILLVVFALASLIPLPAANDVEIYFNYAHRTFNGELPYRDFVIEYPPLALLFFLPPYLLGGNSLPLYTILLHAELFLLNVAALWLAFSLLRSQRDELTNLRGRLGWLTWGSVLISLYLLQRFDIGVAVLTLLAVWFFRRERPAAAGVSLALGTLAKLYPALLLPLFLLLYWYPNRDKRSLLRCLAGFGVAGLLLGLPFVLFGFEGLQGFLAYQGQRGLEIESIYAGLVTLGSYLGLTHALSMVEHGGIGLASPWVAPLATTSTILTVAGVLALLFFLWRNWQCQPDQPRFDWLINAASLLILWFIIANKVISPQYLIWLLVFVPFWRDRLAVRLFLLSLPLSFLAFPFLVDDLIMLGPLTFAILTLRNILLVIIFVRLGFRLLIRPNPQPTLAKRASAGPVNLTVPPQEAVEK